MNLVLKYIFQLIFLIFCQVFVFQKIYLTPFCIPYFYSMIILTLPVFMNRYLVLIVAFLVGWIFDMFYYTGGIHAAALTFIAYLRYYWLKMIEPPERYDEHQLPVVAMTNRNWFLKYITPVIIIHHFLLFTLEAFEIRLIIDILIRTFLSSFIAIILVYLFHLIFFRPSKQ